MIHSTASSSWQNWRAPALIVLGTWLTLAVLFTALGLSAGSFGLLAAVKFALPLWLVWLAFAPLTVWLAFRFPLERGRLPLNLAVHLSAGAVLVMSSQWTLRSFAGRASGGLSGGPPPWVTPSVRESETSQRPPHRAPPAARAALDVLFFAIIVSSCQAVVWSRRARERERRALAAEARFAEARLAALQMQLNPHFLFNALNGISTLVHTNPRAADNMIGSLSELLRLSLASGEKQEVPLEQELDFLQHYLEIEQARFGDRLRVVPDIAPDTRAALVPTLILQPLVENAIRHGIEKQLAPGTITLRSRREGARLILSVDDTGPGLNPAAQNAGGHGIGLENTRARLEQLYGAGQQFSLRGGEQGGCVARLEMPFHLEPMPATPPTSA